MTKPNVEYRPGVSILKALTALLSRFDQCCVAWDETTLSSANSLALATGHVQRIQEGMRARAAGRAGGSDRTVATLMLPADFALQAFDRSMGEFSEALDAVHSALISFDGIVDEMTRLVLAARRACSQHGTEPELAELQHDGLIELVVLMQRALDERREERTQKRLIADSLHLDADIEKLGRLGRVWSIEPSLQMIWPPERLRPLLHQPASMALTEAAVIVDAAEVQDLRKPESTAAPSSSDDCTNGRQLTNHTTHETPKASEAATTVPEVQRGEIVLSLTTKLFRFEAAGWKELGKGLSELRRSAAPGGLLSFSATDGTRVTIRLHLGMALKAAGKKDVSLVAFEMPEDGGEPEQVRYLIRTANTDEQTQLLAQMQQLV